MNPFDEQIGRALSSDTDDVAAPLDLGDHLIERGRSRRRRKYALVGAMSVAAVALAGAAIVTSMSDDPGAIATDPDTTEVTVPATGVVSATTTTAPVGLAPASSLPAEPTPSTRPLPPSTSPTPSTTSATTSTTTSATTSTTTSATTSTTTSTTVPTAPTTTTPAGLERPAGVEPLTSTSTLTVGGLAVEFGRTGQTPDRAATFLVDAGGPVAPLTYELWSPTGRAATMHVSGCDDPSVCGFAEFAYDGSSLWAILERRETVQTTDTTAAFLMRADLGTGDVTEVYAAPALHQLAALTVTDDDRVLTVEFEPASTTFRSGRILEIGTGDGGDTTTIDSIPVDDGTITSAVFSQNGRHLAYATAFASEGRSAIHTHDLADRSGTSIDLTGRLPFYPLVIDWVADSTRLLLADGWEDAGHGVIDIGAPDQIEVLGAEGMYDIEAACVFDDGTIARSTWNIPYAEGRFVRGDIEHVEAEGTMVSTFGLDTVSNSIVCLSGGRVAIAEYPNDDPSDFDSPRRLSIVTPDGRDGSTTAVLAEGSYTVLRR